MTGTQSIERLIALLCQWEGVDCCPHRYGGTAMSLGMSEIARVHENGVLDIHLNEMLAGLLIRANKATPHSLYPESGWVNFHIHCESNLPNALWLLRVAYLYHQIRRHQRRGALSMMQEGHIRQNLQALNLLPDLRLAFEALLD